MRLWRRPAAHWALLLALVAMWGSSFMFTKVAVAALPPTTVVAGRLAVAVVVLTALLVATGVPAPTGRRLWVSCTIMAFVGNALPFWLISWGQQSLDSGLAGILMAVMPLATLVLAHLFVDGERLTVGRAAGFTVGFVGIVVLVGPEAVLALEGSGSHLVAQLAVLAGAVCYAVNTILARRRPGSAPMTAATGVVIAATVMTAPLAAAVDRPWASTFPDGGVGTALLAVLVLGIVSTGVATVVYFKLITVAGPSFLSLINYLIPLWAVGVGMIVLDERPGWRAGLALALVLAGIAASEMGRPAVPRRDD